MINKNLGLVLQHKDNNLNFSSSVNNKFYDLFIEEQKVNLNLFKFVKRSRRLKKPRRLKKSKPKMTSKMYKEAISLYSEIVLADLLYLLKNSQSKAKSVKKLLQVSNSKKFLRVNNLLKIKDFFYLKSFSKISSSELRSK